MTARVYTFPTRHRKVTADPDPVLDATAWRAQVMADELLSIARACEDGSLSANQAAPIVQRIERAWRAWNGGRDPQRLARMWFLSALEHAALMEVTAAEIARARRNDHSESDLRELEFVDRFGRHARLCGWWPPRDVIHSALKVWRRPEQRRGRPKEGQGAMWKALADLLTGGPFGAAVDPKTLAADWADWSRARPLKAGARRK
jgi:hypothetical protein